MAGINNYISAVGNKWSSAPVLYLFSISHCCSQNLYLPTTNYYILKRKSGILIFLFPLLAAYANSCRGPKREHMLGLVSVPFPMLHYRRVKGLLILDNKLNLNNKLK